MKTMVPLATALTVLNTPLANASDATLQAWGNLRHVGVTERMEAYPSGVVGRPHAENGLNFATKQLIRDAIALYQSSSGVHVADGSDLPRNGAATRTVLDGAKDLTIRVGDRGLSDVLPHRVMAAPPPVARIGYTVDEDASHLALLLEQDTATRLRKTALGAATSIDAGPEHTCAVRETGVVQCWGNNDHGQLGDLTKTASAVPVTVRQIDNATAVAVGYSHTCALLQTGAVKCWGANSYGQLGNGTGGDRTRPTTVAGPLEEVAVAISAGLYFTCAIRASGHVVCWGRGSYRELGNGGLGNSNTPVEVNDIGNATQIASGGVHTCAVLDHGAGGVACWGTGDDGQLGDGRKSHSSTPTQVHLPSGAVTVDIDGGDGHTCAVVDAGATYCWGEGDNGKLGNKSEDGSAVPVLVQGVNDVQRIAVGDVHTCALRRSGQVKCWGSGWDGQLGHGSWDSSYEPVDVGGVEAALEISAGDDHNCVRQSSGVLKCWGEGKYGRLGNGERNDTYSATLVNGFSISAPSDACDTPLRRVIREDYDAGADGTVDAITVNVHDVEGRIVVAVVDADLDAQVDRRTLYSYSGGNLSSIQIDENADGKFDRHTEFIHTNGLLTSTQAEDSAGNSAQTTHHYEDRFRRRSTRVVSLAGTSVTTETTYSYHPDGRLFEQTTVDRQGAVLSKAVSQYSQGLLATESWWIAREGQGQTVTFANDYFPDGSLRHRTAMSDTGTDLWRVTYRYSCKGR
jgi:alpha-tubulin suppressor-like RCC1 family protein